jgi:hypothetical protein
MNNRRRKLRAPAAAFSLEAGLLFFIFTFRALALDFFFFCCAGTALPLNGGRGRSHAHDLIGHAVSFLLEFIARFVDCQLGLNHWRRLRQHAQHRLISIGVVQTCQLLLWTA